MKKKLYIIFILIFLLNTIGCEVKTISTKQEVEEIKTTISFDERKFIYNNGLISEQKYVTSLDEKNIEIERTYQVISGLKDKKVQEKINKDLEEVPKSLLAQLEVSSVVLRGDDFKRINKKRLGSYIVYNFNNVIFVEFYVQIDAGYNSYGSNTIYKSIYMGYDLNTGELIELADLFKPDMDYKTKINNYICQYIIENNYDDYSSERMIKPFQGIRNDQSFSIGLEGLRIILDEKNDEFVNYGFSDQILIPLNYFGDGLYIFDRYFDENISIFEKEKLSKKLIPNKIEFRTYDSIEEGNEKYYISIPKCKFINVPDKNIEKRMNDMLVTQFDLEGFKKKAISLRNGVGVPHYTYYIQIFTNAGGYFSIAASEEIFFNGAYESNRAPFNYNFNQNKEMLLEDLFVAGTDVGSVIISYIEKLNYFMTEEMLESGVKDILSNKNFNFDEGGIIVYFSPKGADLETHQKWIYIPFEEFGIENISILN